MKKFASLFLSVVLAFTLVVPTAWAAEPEYAGKTVILHSNDVHGTIDKYAYMAALRDEYEGQGADVILADAGDYSQGTTYVSTTKGEDAFFMMNAVGYDVATIGNHEFDYGWAQLKANAEKADFKIICADVLENGATIFDPNTIIEKEGVKIGFFGMETPEAQTKANPALIKGLTFLAGEEMYDCAQAQVNALETAGADVIICLSHLGVDAASEPNTSYDLLENTTGIDMVIDGHSHTVMEATAEEPIQSTGTAFSDIGVIVIDNDTKEIVDNSLYEVPGTLTADATVAAEAQSIIDRVKVEYGEVFAKSDVALNGAKAPNGNRDSETNLGDLITDAILWTATKEEGSITVPAENVVAITNGGGIRAPINVGDVTKNNINTVLPFGNTVTVVYVTGAELLEALEASTYCTPDAIGGFPQVSGMKFFLHTVKAYDANEETYPASTYYGPKTINRVTIDSINGEEFDPEATYAVVTNDFCAAGGDTYYAFAAASSKFDTGVPMDEAVMSYVKEVLGGVIGEEYAKPQGRIVVHTAEDEIIDTPEVAATCGAAGHEAVSHCGLCGKVLSKAAVIPATGEHTEEVDVAAKAATCGADGHEAVSHCSVCGKVLSKGKTIPATGNHTTKATTTKATLKANGKIVYKCPTCDKTMQSTKTIYMPKTFSLSYTKTTYNGKVKAPAVTVKDSKGNVLKKGTDYTVTYASGRKAVGTYQVTIKGIGNYSFTKTLTFKINPAATKIVSATNVATKSIKVKWDKAAGAGGYQVKYVKGSTTKTIKVSGASTLTKTLTKLTKGSTYKVSVRSYKTVDGTTYYSAYSTAKSVKVAK